MIVEIEERLDDDCYNRFVKSNSSVTFYHSSKYLKFLQRILGENALFVTVREKGELLGALPIFTKKSTYGMVVNSLPFFGSYGGVISENRDIQEILLKSLNNFNEENEVLSSVIIANPFLKNNEFYDQFYKFEYKEERRIQCLTLKDKSQENLWSDLEQRTRRAIRKGQKSSITVTKTLASQQDMHKFYEMHKKDMESKNGRPKPLRFFEYLNESFIQGEDFDIFKAVKDDLPIAYLLVYYYEHFVEYYMPAYQSDTKNLQPTSLLIWESLKNALEKNMHYYNFGGTWKDQIELYTFKKGWNTIDYFYNYYVHSDLAKLREIGVEEIKRLYENFYVGPYDKILKV